jgi:predicted lipoprotein with Yx(FWY)xxD motif
MKRIFGSLAAVLILALVAAACGGGDDDSSVSSRTTTTKAQATTTTSAATTTTSGATTTTSAATTTTSGAGATVKTASTGLGTIVVNADGKTLYAFANDQGTTSACTGGCATIWPPLMDAGTPTAGAGIDASKLSKAPSGQVVYNGHLLYTYASDASAGQTNGQGVGGVWHVVAPSGDIIS